MNIVFFTLSMNKGGAERVISNLCNDYLSFNNNITIITCTNEVPQYNLNKKIKIVSVDSEIKEKDQNKIFRFLRRRRSFKNIVQNMEIDIIISFLPEPCFISLSIKKSIKCPIIISVRNDPKIEYSFLPYKMLMKLLYPKADGTVFQTEDAKNYFSFSKEIYNNSEVIANPLNKEFIGKTFNGERKKKIVAVGRLFEQKNYPLLIKSFYAVNKQLSDYNLQIYGEGVLRETLQNLINKLNMQNRIELCGQKDNIIDNIFDSSLFVMTSNFEGMPNSLMEAMTLGLPVIATDCPCGGPKSLIENRENGILIPVNDQEALSKAMIEVLNDQELLEKISKNATKIVEKLAPDIIYDKWEKYIKKVINQYKNRR